MVLSDVIVQEIIALFAYPEQPNSPFDSVKSKSLVPSQNENGSGPISDGVTDGVTVAVSLGVELGVLSGVVLGVTVAVVEEVTLGVEAAVVEEVTLLVVSAVLEDVLLGAIEGVLLRVAPELSDGVFEELGTLVGDGVLLLLCGILLSTLELFEGDELIKVEELLDGTGLLLDDCEAGIREDVGSGVALSEETDDCTGEGIGVVTVSGKIISVSEP